MECGAQALTQASMRREAQPFKFSQLEKATHGSWLMDQLIIAVAFVAIIVKNKNHRQKQKSAKFFKFRSDQRLGPSYNGSVDPPGT